jgi:small-conductance mechanosensitive channel
VNFIAPAGVDVRFVSGANPDAVWERERESEMAIRKQFLENSPVDPELAAAMVEARKRQVTEEELREQRISFAFGNALNSEGITKDSVRATSQSLRLRA